MDESSFIEVSVAQARDFYPKGHFIGEDFLVYEHFSEVPLPWKSCRMQCLFFALCTQGEASYTVDAKASRIKQGDVIIVGEGQLIENFLASDDCDGIAIMISYDFFNDIVAGIRDLNTLFLFSRLHPVFSLTEREVNVLSSYIDTIIAKILEPEHHFRRELVSTLMKALIYDMSNVIYRYQMGEKKRFSRGEVVFFNYPSGPRPFQARAARQLVCPSALYHPKISIRNHQDHQQANAQRMDRLLCRVGTASVAEKFR